MRARGTYDLDAEFLTRLGVKFLNAAWRYEHSRADLAVKFTDRIAFKSRENSDFIALTQVVFQTASAQLGLRLSYERVYCADCA